MRAVVVTVQALPHRVQASLDFVPRRLHHSFRHHAAGNTGLIRDDNDSVSHSSQEANGFDTEGIHLETLEAVDISHIFDEGAVTVEKHSWG